MSIIIWALSTFLLKYKSTAPLKFRAPNSLGYAVNLSQVELALLAFDCPSVFLLSLELDLT